MLHEDATVSVEFQDLPQSLLGCGHSFFGPFAFCGLIADGWGVRGVPLGRVQRWRQRGVTVLVVRLWAGQPLIVPGLAAAVALTVHRALLHLQSTLVLRQLLGRALAGAGPPGLLGRGYLLRLGGAQQTSHRQHPLNGLFCAG